MRIRVIRRSTTHSIDGIQLDPFEVGYEYDDGYGLGRSWFAKGWADVVPLDDSRAVAVRRL